MFTLVFSICVLSTVLMIAGVVRSVWRDGRASREISRAGEDFLTRWRA